MVTPAQLRSRAAKVAEAACALPVGPDRACQFAYALGLEDAADMLEGLRSPRRDTPRLRLVQ